MRKFLISLLMINCAVFCTLGIVACAPKGLEAHSWSNEWTSNINSHWHRCMDSGCNGRDEYNAHEWVLTDSYEAATCGDTGLGQYTCSVCKATLGNSVTPATIPATGEHNYKLYSVDVEPTCGGEGYGSYICEVCYDYAVLPIPATGEHDFSGKYAFSEEGHYHVCRHGCGVDDGIKPHVKGEGIRIEPTGMQDGRIEYRCTVCNYLMDSDVIINTNVLHHFEVRFVKVTNNSTVLIPEIGEDGELYVTLNKSSNANGGYYLEYTGYNIDGEEISLDGVAVKLYHYDEFTGRTTQLTIGNMGQESVGHFGYLDTLNQFFVTGAAEGASLLIEFSPRGRDPVSLKVNILTA